MDDLSVKSESTKFEWIGVECDCHFADHMIRFCLDPDDGEVFVDVQLSPWHGFWARCWIAVKYIFGINTRSGHWDCCLLNDKADAVVEILMRAIAIREREREREREQERDHA